MKIYIKQEEVKMMSCISLLATILALLAIIRTL